MVVKVDGKEKGTRSRKRSSKKNENVESENSRTEEKHQSSTGTEITPTPSVSTPEGATKTGKRKRSDEIHPNYANKGEDVLNNIFTQFLVAKQSDFKTVRTLAKKIGRLDEKDLKSQMKQFQREFLFNDASSDSDTDVQPQTELIPPTNEIQVSK